MPFDEIQDQRREDSLANYQGLRVWNRDMTVDAAAIRVVLEDSADPNAKSADANRFFDNSLIQAVSREHAGKLFRER